MPKPLLFLFSLIADVGIALRALLSSKKTLTLIAGLAVTWFAKHGYDVTNEEALGVLGLFAVLIHAQGNADQGKEAAKIAAAGPAAKPSGGPIGVVSMLLIALVVLASCAKHAPVSTATPPAPASSIIDCTTGDMSSIAAIAAMMSPLLVGGTVSWQAVADAAIAAGEKIGGCLIADLLPPPQQAEPRVAFGPRSALSKFRSALGSHRTIHTTHGDF